MHSVYVLTCSRDVPKILANLSLNVLVNQALIKKRVYVHVGPHTTFLLLELYQPYFFEDGR